MSSSRLSKKQKNMLEALRLNMGNVTLASKAADVGRSTHYDWVNANEKYEQAVLDIEDENVDLSESELIKLIQGGNFKAIEYHLNSKGQSRGYGKPTQVELTGKDGEPITPPKKIGRKELEQQLKEMGFSKQGGELETKQI